MLTFSIPLPDAEVQADVQVWMQPLETFTQQVAGHTSVFLDGTRESCRNKECTMGQ